VPVRGRFRPRAGGGIAAAVTTEELGRVGGGRKSLRVTAGEPELAASLHVTDGNVDGAIKGGADGGGPPGTSGRRSISPVQVSQRGNRAAHAARLVSRIEFTCYPADGYGSVSNQR
jgi:hypothetical protein